MRRRVDWLPGTLNLIDRHVLREWLTILIYAVGATFGILMLAAVIDMVPDLRDNHASLGQMLLYFAVRAPSSLAVVLPLSVLISLLYSLGRMHRNNELIAMRAAGLGLYRVTRWIWIFTAGLAVFSFFLNSTIIPWSVEKTRLVEDNIRFANEEKKSTTTTNIGVTPAVAYLNRTQHRLTMIGRFSEYSYAATDIHVSEFDRIGRETRRILGTEGYWDAEKNQWFISRGREILMDPETGREIHPVLTVENRAYPELRDDPRWMILLAKRPKDLSFTELDRILAAPETRDNPKQPAYAVAYHSRLAGTLQCLLAAALAVPFAVGGVRVNPAVGVSKSIGLFVMFIVLDFIGTHLGEQRIAAPMLAAWLPNLTMSCLAGWFVMRAR